MGPDDLITNLEQDDTRQLVSNSAVKITPVSSTRQSEMIFSHKEAHGPMGCAGLAGSQ